MSQTVIHLKRIPSGVPGYDDFDIVQRPIPTESDLKDGEVVVKVEMVSIDPAMRMWISGKKTYIDPVKPGTTMYAGGVGQVTASKSTKFAIGDKVSGMLGWNEYSIQSQKLLSRVPDVPAETLLGIFGLTSLTAFFGILRVGQIKKGDTVVVSTAGGATGSIVCQIAKIHGCRVVGIAGGAKKCQYVVDHFGANACIDYKNTTDLRKDIKKACPKGVDVYFDNVGGVILDTVLGLANDDARFVMCGAISTYNANGEDAVGIKNYPVIISRRIRMQGFIVTDFAKEFKTAIGQLMQWSSEGKLTQNLQMFEGLNKAPEALNVLLSGKNTGKTLVRITPQTAKL